MNQAYVSSRLLAGLAALGVGDVGTSSIVGQARSAQIVGIFVRLRQREGHLHENQLCERRSRSRVDRFANEIFGGRSDATFQRQFIALDQRKQSGAGKFGWGRGYGVFSVSESAIAEVARYIANQEEHHRKRNFAEELKLFVERYGLEWREG
ncbi:MAG TPA: transposase [Verrucomicrobiae bacterium]|nr:transposase [Verrucomicrobiae bacterium]